MKAIKILLGRFGGPPGGGGGGAGQEYVQELEGYLFGFLGGGGGHHFLGGQNEAKKSFGPWAHISSTSYFCLVGPKKIVLNLRRFGGSNLKAISSHTINPLSPHSKFSKSISIYNKYRNNEV